MKTKRMKTKTAYILSLFVLTMMAPAITKSQPFQDDFQSVTEKNERIDWHRKARFGAMVHFTPDMIGKMYYYDRKELPDPYRGRPIPAKEFDRYYTKMTLQNFNAEAWVKTFVDAGMNYFVFVAKHHNGFCLWDSKYTDYDIYAVTGRDVVKELSEACAKYHITFCLYYSIMDWHHPHATGDSHGGTGYELPQEIEPDLENYIAYMNAQLVELTTNYGPIGLMWYDGAWMSRWSDNPELQWTENHAEDLYNLTLNLQEGMMCNNRMQKQHYEMVDGLGDYYTPENFIGNFDRTNHWESVIKLGTSWHWVPSEPVKSRGEVLQTLCRCAGSDGNLLLNVGPHPDGYIMPNQISRLKEVGDWLEKNGEAIYGTRGGPYLPSSGMVSTHKGQHVYLHIFSWPQPGDDFVLPALEANVLFCESMDGSRLQFKEKEGRIHISVPGDKRGTDVTIIKLILDRNATDVPVKESGEKADHGVDTKQEIEQENL